MIKYVKNDGPSAMSQQQRDLLVKLVESHYNSQHPYAQPPQAAQPPEYTGYDSPTVHKQNTSGVDEGSSYSTTYPSTTTTTTTTSQGGLMTAEAEILQTLQVLQLQVTSLQDQMAFLIDHLQGARSQQQQQQQQRGGESPGKGKEKELPEENVGEDSPSADADADPAEQLRRRRLMRFSNQ